MGSIGGIVPKDFFLVGSKEDPRTTRAIRLMDYEKLIFHTPTDLVSNFNIGHRAQGLVSVEDDVAGSELLITLGQTPYFDTEVNNVPSARQRRVIGIVQNQV